MAIKINSENRNKKRRINLVRLDKIAGIVLKTLKKKDIELNIVFLSSQKIRVLNRLYLDIDKATDVIAFSGVRLQASGFRVDKMARGGAEFMGDIAISTDRAARNSKIYGTAFFEEVALYVIHGILHLAGYEDTTKAGRAAMRRKEDEFLQKIKKVS